MFGSSGKRLVGLDIGTSSIKAVLLKHSSKGYALENLGIETLPPEVIVDRSILDATVVSMPSRSSFRALALVSKTSPSV